jgi:hypothetical protein
MGACFQAYSVDGKKTAQELKVDFQRVQEQDRYENGHSYSGGFGQCSGLNVTNNVFPDRNAADEWLGDNTKKWDAAKAVRFVSGDGTERWMIGGWCAE